MHRIRDSASRVRLWFRVEGFGFKLWALGFRASGLRLGGLGFRVFWESCAASLCLSATGLRV